MIRHLFKLMWNRKRRNVLLSIEMLVSFLVVFVLTSTLIGWGLQYLKPLGFEPDNLWIVHVDWQQRVKDQTEQQAREIMMQIEREATAFDEVSGLCWTFSNTPYGYSTWTSVIDWHGQKVSFHVIKAGDNYGDVLGVHMKEGTWYGRESDGSSAPPVVINSRLKELLVGAGATVAGQIISSKDHEYLVTGVVNQFRYKGELDNEPPIMFRRVSLTDTAAEPPTTAIIRVRPGTGVLFQKTFTDDLARVAPGWNISVESLSELRSDYLRTRYMALLAPVVLGGFLVFNVALGLFGILWYSISRRRAELGLRRALGASASHVNYQVIGEALAMTTFSVIVGVILAAHAPVLSLLGESVTTTAYLLAIACSALVIYFLVLMCSWYPAHLAANIHPAEALHDE